MAVAPSAARQLASHALRKDHSPTRTSSTLKMPRTSCDRSALRRVSFRARAHSLRYSRESSFKTNEDDALGQGGWKRKLFFVHLVLAGEPSRHFIKSSSEGRIISGPRHLNFKRSWSGRSYDDVGRAVRARHLKALDGSAAVVAANCLRERDGSLGSEFKARSPCIPMPQSADGDAKVSVVRNLDGDEVARGVHTRAMHASSVATVATRCLIADAAEQVPVGSISNLKQSREACERRRSQRRRTTRVADDDSPGRNSKTMSNWPSTS